jgi:hypothetical protein
MLRNMYTPPNSDLILSPRLYSKKMMSTFLGTSDF